MNNLQNQFPFISLFSKREELLINLTFYDNIIKNINISYKERGNMEYFSEDEKFLLLEANLTLATIADGLDCLKNANVYQKGIFYQAFFSLSIGIERLLKLIIIDKHRIENQGRFPSNKVIRNYRTSFIRNGN